MKLLAKLLCNQLLRHIYQRFLIIEPSLQLKRKFYWHFIIIKKIQLMTESHQFVISLIKLTMPFENTWQRAILSVATPTEEYFIQNQKIVKGSKINFYREKLFIYSYSGKLWFNLYGINQDKSKILIKTFVPEKKQLQKVNKRSILFNIKEDEYELVWESWIFTEQSSYIYQQSQRDYTQLNLPFENQDSLILMDSKSQDSRLSNVILSERKINKRSSSTEQTSSLRNQDFKFLDDAENKIHLTKPVQRKEKSQGKNRRQNFHVISPERRKKTHIKSQIYSYVVSGISDFLYPIKV